MIAGVGSGQVRFPTQYDWFSNCEPRANAAANNKASP